MFGWKKIQMGKYYSVLIQEMGKYQKKKLRRMSKIRLRLKPITEDTNLLEWTKNKGFFSVEIGKPFKVDRSKQSSFKNWNQRWEKK